MSSDVEMQRPADLQAAMSLARAFERRAGAVAGVSSLTGGRSTARTRPSSTASTSTTQAPTTNSQWPRFRRLSPDEMADKRRKGECYFCPEFFSLDHKCAMKGVFLMELDDHDDPDSLADDLGISLHALTGISATNTMQLKITIVGTELLALVDSGSTHTFIDDQVVSRLGLDIMLRPGFR
jgi:hypothetical protein